MTLGEALTLRAKQQQRLTDLSNRIRLNALVQEGDAPQESVRDLLDQFVSLSDEHRVLVKQIIEANVTTAVGERTLLDLLQERADTVRIRNMYSLTAVAATPGNNRFMRSELRLVPAGGINVTELRQFEREADEHVRTLDAQIQAVNWKTLL